jgi:hypothetical protein
MLFGSPSPWQLNGSNGSAAHGPPWSNILLHCALVPTLSSHFSDQNVFLESICFISSQALATYDCLACSSTSCRSFRSWIHVCQRVCKTPVDRDTVPQRAAPRDDRHRQSCALRTRPRCAPPLCQHTASSMLLAARSRRRRFPPGTLSCIEQRK